MTLRLVLSLHNNYSIDINKSQLVKLFPESLLGRAIEQDPDANEIIITHKFVNPNVLICIQHLVENQAITRLNSDKDHLIASANYFNMDALALLTDLNLRKFIKNNPQINLLNFSQLQDPDIYQTILQFGVAYNDTTLVDYLFRMVGLDINPDSVKEEFAYTTRRGTIEMIKLFLFHKVDLNIPHLLSNSASRNGVITRIDVINVLIGTGYQFDIIDVSNAIIIADLSTAIILLNKYPLDKDRINSLLKRACQCKGYDLIEHILKYFKVSDETIKWIWADAIALDDQKVVDLLESTVSEEQLYIKDMVNNPDYQQEHILKM